MAASGVYRVSKTFNEIAAEVLDNLGVGVDGETLNGTDVTRVRNSFNYMIGTLEAQGLHLWTQTEGTLFLQKSQSEYNFSTAKLANTWYETTLSAAEALGQTVLSCTSTANMSASDNIGIVLDDGTIHWSTIASKTSTTVTINAALPSAAASGNFVRNYTTAMIPANRITSVRRRDSSTYEQKLALESRDSYFRLTDKTSAGVPVQAYFSRQMDEGKMYIWPAPDSAEYCLNITYERPLQSVTANTETIDVPQYWLDAIIFDLAVRCAPKFGCSMERLALLKSMKDETLTIAIGFDSDPAPIVMELHNAY